MIDESSLEAILGPLIEVDTSNPPGKNYEQIVKVIEKQLAHIGCNIELVRTPEERVKELIKEAEGISGERVNLIASLERGKGKTVILNAHTDVVPAGDGWTHPPFKLSKKGREWHGRGVADDKGPLAMLILVFKELAENPDWQGRIVLAPTVDEEIGGHTGLAYLLDAGLLKGDCCIVGDGGIENITNAANGCLRFRVTLRGKAVHSSRNWMGVNAVEKGAKLTSRLGEYNTSLHGVKSKVPANPQTGVDWLTPSVTVGVVRGGTKVNIVPDRCVLEIDRRVIPEEDKAEEVIKFKNMLEEFRRGDEDFKYDIVVGGFHDSFYTPMDSEIVTTLSQVYREVTGREGRIFGTLACVDAAHVAKQGIPVAVFGASRVGSNIHGIDERVRIDDLKDFGLIVEKTVLRILR
jgi:succinyl-diaminopimelate desuccinylase